MKSYQTKVESSIKSKLSTPQKVVESPELGSLKELTDLIFTSIEKINQKGSELNSKIQEFRKSIEGSLIEEKLSKLEEEGKLLIRKIKRHEYSKKCDEFQGLEKKIEELEKEIELLRSELEKDQNEFLKKYFSNLNRYFKDFGSEDFELEMISDKSGNIPIYFLRVKFQGKVIRDKELNRIFSESDRRALSLAVFWAKLDQTHKEELKKTIVIFDDPVTSFDDNRVSTIHRKIIELSESTNQIILLSHYKAELSKFLDTFKQHRKKTKLFSLSNTNKESTLNKENIEEFIQDDHEKRREKIFKFINKETNSDESQNLRIFLEKEVSLRFAKQIKDKKITCSDFYGVLNKLKDFEIIEEEVFEKCNRWRECLNRDHHKWSDGVIEDQRNSAKELMKFIFDELVPMKDYALTLSSKT